MPATLEFESRAAEKAELEDLLLRLQDAHLEAGWPKILTPPGWVQRYFDSKKKEIYVSSKELATTCLRILKEDAASVTLDEDANEVQKTITVKMSDETFESYLTNEHATITFRTFPKFGDTSTLLIELWHELKKEHRTKNDDKQLTVRTIANKWQFLKPALLNYQKDERSYSADETKAVKTHINILLKQMEVFGKYWKDQFKLAN
jgi:hypothetical protein